MNKKRIITIIIITMIIGIIIGGTFAYWTWQSASSEDTNITLTVGSNFSCSANGGGNITNTRYFAPTTCLNQTYALKRKITTNITNTSGAPVYMDLWLNINSIDTGLSNSDNFMYVLTTEDNNCTDNIVASGNFKGKAANDKVELLSGVTSGSTYYLYIWLDAAETSQTTMNQSVNLTLGGECTNETPTSNVLYDIIASQADLTTTIDFSQVSSDTNGKGVYRFPGTENNTYPVYYYRGDIDNNHVKFANFCWKIVRTTDTGGVKLIYDGVPSNGECNNTGTATHISTTNTAFNSSYNSPAYVGYMYGDVYAYSSATGTNWYYGPDVTYANGTYTLTAKGSYNVEKKSTISGTNLNYQHYTCGSRTGTTCTSVRYVYNVTSSTAYYITLANGKIVEDALSEMLTNSSNTTNSTIKTAIDTWYQSNMTSYTSYLEDTIYCNDRSIGTLNGWNPDGGSATSSLRFSGYNRSRTTYSPSLSCTSKNDSFTVSESATGNGKLTYPVGLLTSDEAMLAGGKGGTANTSYYLNNGSYYWLGSPSGFYINDYAREFFVGSGSLNDGYLGFTRGARPSVSLKLGMKISGGDGTSTNPYIVE